MRSLKSLVPDWLAPSLWWIPFTYRQVFKARDFKVAASDYEEYFEQKDAGHDHALNLFQKHRADFVLRRLRDGDSILDVSCGTGSTLLYLASKRKVKASGTEYAQAAIRHGQSKGLDVVFHDVNKHEDIDGLPESDYITMFEILEHMPNPEGYLQKIAGKARKGVFFSFPNTGYFPYRLRLLFGSFPVQWIVHPGEHLRYWTYRDLKWWLRNLGLKDRSTIDIYQGVPFLNRICGPLFGMAFIVFVDTAGGKEARA